MIFDNCLIQAPDGASLSRCGRKKLKWYLKNDLAELISEDPPTIRLKFEPSGREGANDPFLLDGKPNVCVVCGSKENLTRHHIIPYCFIRHMDLEYKMDIIRDIFPLCRPCHNEYEKLSWKKRKEMSKNIGVPINKSEIHKPRKNKASWAARTILKYQKQIPEYRKEELNKIIFEAIGKSDYTEEDLFELQSLGKEQESLPAFAKVVAEQIEDYNEFAKEWRLHFVETMNPNHMPEMWRVDRKTENVWVPRRILNQS